jgi:hypothetical protein
MSNYNSTLQSNNTDLQAILNAINELPEAGTDLPELTNEGTSANLLSGKQLINSDGEVVTGSMSNNGSISSTMDGISTKSITVPAGYTSGGTVSLDDTIDTEVDEQADLIEQLITAIDGLPEAGVELPELTNEGSAGELFSGKEFIDQDGNKVTGTFSIDNELSVQDDLIAQIQAAVDNLPEASGGGNESGSNCSGKHIVSVTITDNLGMDGAYYFNDNGEIMNVTNTTKTVNALMGLVFIKSVLANLGATGNFVLSDNGSVKACRFLEDGGSATVYSN